MITPALPLSFGEPPRPRFTVAPSNLPNEAPAILDGNQAIAWAASETLAQRIADFLNWRAAMDAVDRRYAEALQADQHLHA